MSATVAGRHQLKSDVREACGAIERTLLNGTTEYAVQSLVPESPFTRHGGRGGSGLLAVKINESSFMAVWDDESSFEAPSSAFGDVGRHLGVTGEVNVMVNAIVDNVAMDPLRIEIGSLHARLDTTVFELELPAEREGGTAKGEITFAGLASRTEDATTKLAIFGESRPSMASVPAILERALGALSGYCGAITRWAQ